MFKKLLIFFYFVTSMVCYSQVGIGNTNPNGALDITSTNNGLLIPRIALTATNIATVLTPTVSELVYNTATSASGAFQVTPGYYYWNGTLWVRLAAGTNTTGTDWTVIGNATTNPLINFLGTTDNVDLRLKTNNIDAFNISTSRTLEAFNLGSNTLPIFSWSSDTDTGMYSPGNDQLGFSAGGIEFLKLNENTLDEIIVNDNGIDLDFRVETDNNTGMLLVNGSNNQVQINTTSGILTGSHLSLGTNSGLDGARFFTSGAGESIYTQSTSSGHALSSISIGSGDAIRGISTNTSIGVYGGNNGSSFAVYGGIGGTGTNTAGMFQLAAASTSNTALAAIPFNGQVGLYSDNTFTTPAGIDTNDGIISYTSSNVGFGSGWFVNSGTGNGTGFGTATASYGVLANSANPGNYNVGVIGQVESGDASTGFNSAGIYGINGVNLGGNVTTTSAGALAYRNDSGSGGTYYGGFFQANNVGDIPNGNGTFRLIQSANNQPMVNVGFGAKGDLFGGWTNGTVYGFATSGKRYGLYVDGKSYTNNIITQLTTQENSIERVATYVPTSTSVDITIKGMNKLSNGTARIDFKKNFSNIASSEEPIIVTVTPIGESNGIHLVSVDKNGFTIKENKNGSSNVQFTWIAIATKSGYETVETPEELINSNYDKKLEEFTNVNISTDTKNKVGEMWWDGAKINYSNTPVVKSYNKNEPLKSKVVKKYKFEDMTPQDIKEKNVSTKE